ncbi:hypothetical protein CPY51_23055 [Rhizobium tubonense]|uniref:Uncharacterized protein n=1 Tax=Rhizobium tubonense TaxID=484088 RepID=A0A2W4CAQ4_9HYPH|nr:hypothetical protein CPY51_23055 [Rhizobium tubonense]
MLIKSLPVAAFIGLSSLSLTSCDVESGPKRLWRIQRTAAAIIRATIPFPTMAVDTTVADRQSTAAVIDITHAIVQIITRTGDPGHYDRSRWSHRSDYRRNARSYGQGNRMFYPDKNLRH